MNMSDSPAFSLSHAGGFARFPKGLIICAAIGVSMLAGCSWTPSPEQLTARMDEYAETGYRPEHTHATEVTQDTWKHGPTSLDIVYLAPVEPGSYPLIVYLPGLGEDASAAPLWRNAWAEAGYAVLSLQPVTISRVARPPERLSRGDMRAAGRQYFAPEALAARLGHLAWAIEELRRRAQGGDPRYASADPNRLTVAGFDIGAQVASAAAGEQIHEAGEPVGGLTPRAAIIISPYMPVADGRSDDRFSTIATAVLTVTGTDDEDPYGLTPLSLRGAAWAAMPRGEKYLLSLRGGRHKELAGADFSESEDEPPEFEDLPMGPGSSPGYASQLRWSAYGGGGNGPPSGGPGMMGDGPAPASRAPSYRRPAIVRGVTTAFLDAVVKHSAIARDWLTGSASGWMGRSASLKRR